MKKLFLIDGVAGTGKTDMIEYIKQKYPSQAMIQSKYTTRSKRIEEDYRDVDLTFVSEDEFECKKNDKNFYSYLYGDKTNGFHQYGFYKHEIISALKLFEYVVVIVRSKQLIEQLSKDFDKLAIVMPLFIYSDRSLVVDRLKKDGYNEEQIEFRILRSESCWRDYIENDYFNTLTIINNSNKADFGRKINQLFNLSDLYEMDNYLYINPILKFEITKPLVGYKKELDRMLKQHPYDKNIFLMMKFRAENHSTYEFIRDEINSYGYNCVRADQDEWQITGTPFNPMAIIYCCKFGIALFDEGENGSDYSPNVAYELGMMQTQNKECLILINADLPSPPFDLVKDLYKSYKRESQLKTIIKSWLARRN